MEYIGWVGTFFGIVSFAFLSFGILKKEGKLFPLFSGIASLSFLISSFLISNYQAVISNSFFLLSSILALFGIFIKIEKIKEKMLYILCLCIFIISSLYYIIFTKEIWIFQSLGWIPVISLPMIFFLFTQNKINEIKYYYLNMATNIIFFIHLIYFNNYPLAILQVVAFIFALIGVIRLSKFDFLVDYNKIK
jgi:hypothetical protein